MTINANTKIAAILKHNADALEAIISISPKFSKLRNPLLRKLMASRTSIGTASKIGGCTVSDFYNKLKPLGFTIDTETKEEKTLPKQAKPDFMLKLTTDNTTELDVRPILETGKDPLSIIVEKTNELPKEHTLKLINSFEPTPLIQLLEKKGYIAYSETVSENLIYTYFYKSLNV
ncbi:MAG: DUF2249 domain-containing protein, partial [Bacteroidia bacterium]|nr:DUF2249 domain-containing protein [Bacteroidia bacterium]